MTQAVYYNFLVHYLKTPHLQAKVKSNINLNDRLWFQARGGVQKVLADKTIYRSSVNLNEFELPDN